MGRARLRQLRDAERLAHDLRDRGRLADSLVPLGDGLQHSHDVDELVGFLVGLVGAGLARQRDLRGQRAAVNEAANGRNDQRELGVAVGASQDRRRWP